MGDSKRSKLNLSVLPSFVFVVFVFKFYWYFIIFLVQGLLISFSTKEFVFYILFLCCVLKPFSPSPSLRSCYHNGCDFSNKRSV